MSVLRGFAHHPVRFAGIVTRFSRRILIGGQIAAIDKILVGKVAAEAALTRPYNHLSVIDETGQG